MTGRGIDQVLPHPGNPVLYEPYMHDAREYVQLAEKVYGAIPRPVDYDYIWGDVLAEFDRARTDLRIVNLETRIRPVKTTRVCQSGGYAALFTMFVSCSVSIPGYRRTKVSRSSSLSTFVRRYPGMQNEQEMQIHKKPA
jgi:hypothetical protein